MRVVPSFNKIRYRAPPSRSYFPGPARSSNTRYRSWAILEKVDILTDALLFAYKHPL